ncbi:MAG: hypothetical protein AAB453_01275 [Patescibacteria group bacterium]
MQTVANKRIFLEKVKNKGAWVKAQGLLSRRKISSPIAYQRKLRAEI